MSYEVKLEFKLAEFYSTKEIKYSFTLDETSNEHTYNIIISRDLLNKLSMNILYSKSHLVWNGIAIAMKSAANIILKKFG